MIVLNLFGGPGSGKSTLAAEMFAAMKRAGMNVELVTEYAKDMVWEGRFNVLDDQLYILAKQHRRLKRLVGKVDYAITDSPLLLSAFYLMEPDGLFTDFVVREFARFNNVNYWLSRPGPETYSKVGRVQSYEEATEVDTALQSFVAGKYLAQCSGAHWMTLPDEVTRGLVINSLRHGVVPR